MNFSELGLSSALLEAVAQAGYDTPTPIQQQAIPRILEGGDLIASAQTGTGKTAAFALPIMHRLSQKNFTKQRPIRALVIAPTRELVSQVGGSFRTLGATLSPKLRVVEVFGGVKIEAQQFKLKLGTDVLVATPGRLLDLVEQNDVRLSSVEVLVVDEGDRMLEMGFQADLKKICQLLPVHCQHMMFSATFSDEVEHLASFFLHKPHRIATAASGAPAPRIKQIACAVQTPDKPEALRAILDKDDDKQVLVFVNTRAAAVEVSRALSFQGFGVGALHGDVEQKGRSQVLAAFAEGKVRVLVATDVAARGLHIPDLPLVINYELPRNIDDYVHRIGRTGRAGAAGKAISLVAPGETEQLGYIEDLIGSRLEKQKIAGFKPGQLDTHRRRKEELEDSRLQRVVREQKAEKGIAAGKSRSPQSAAKAAAKAWGTGKSSVPFARNVQGEAALPGKPKATSRQEKARRNAESRKAMARREAERKAMARQGQKKSGKQRPGR